MNGDELRRIEDKLDSLIIQVTKHLAEHNARSKFVSAVLSVSRVLQIAILLFIAIFQLLK